MLIKLKLKQKLLIELKKTTHCLGPLCLKNCFWDTLNQMEVPLFFRERSIGPGGSGKIMMGLRSEKIKTVKSHLHAPRDSGDKGLAVINKQRAGQTEFVCTPVLPLLLLLLLQSGLVGLQSATAKSTPGLTLLLLLQSGFCIAGRYALRIVHSA